MSYREIYKTLKNDRMLSARPNVKFPFLHTEGKILSQSGNFAKNMGLDNIDELFESCEKNVLVFAKLILSIYRRANELYKYQDEGRVQKL